jgi:gamma-glutamylcyclotransferase (GGCT)/AIG2-like uncharacterized protein YtfP
MFRTFDLDVSIDRHRCDIASKMRQNENIELLSDRGGSESSLRGERAERRDDPVTACTRAEPTSLGLGPRENRSEPAAFQSDKIQKVPESSPPPREKMRDEYLFVYGTLRRDPTGKTHPLLTGAAQFVGAARCQGRLYRIADYPGLVPSDNSRDVVLGEAYKLEQPALLLPRLDDYEGCGPRFSRPTEYVRRLQKVRLDDATILAAWAYLYNRGIAGLTGIESGDILLQK